MSKYPIFSVIGIEIEYMLVDKTTLNVQPKSDIILQSLAENTNVFDTVVLGEVALSNELVMHVLELKNNGPKPPAAAIGSQFHQTLLQLQTRLAQNEMRLLPTGAHPWMDPLQETQRWPHGQREVYQQYDKIFNCQGHGWSNLQSMHVNLPFANDEEFFHLHSLIRQLLPLLPALAASTPILDGQPSGYLDTRLACYANNQRCIPSITGDIIPEFVRSRQDYEQTILAPIYRDLAAYDPAGLLQHEWVNSRGAIAKFKYGAIEIRIIDTQECVQADLAIALATHAILQSWYETSHIHIEKPCTTQALRKIYDEAIVHGMSALVEDSAVLVGWHLPKRTMRLRDVWSMLIEQVSSQLDYQSQCCLEHILRQGNLSERILRACQKNYQKDTLLSVYRQLADCLQYNQCFEPL